MADIFAVRGGGQNRGPDIVDPLLTTIAACMSRGRNTLDQHSMIRQAEVTIPFRSGLRLGQLAEVHDVLTGSTWRGKISGIHYVYGQSDLLVTLTIQRPT